MIKKIPFHKFCIKKTQILSESTVLSKNPRMIIRGFWWERVDSNHRSYKQQIYSLSPLATRELSLILWDKINLPLGAGDGTRTRNLLITNQLLCQLSYTSIYIGGSNRARTCDPLLVRQMLSQLSYTPIIVICFGRDDRIRTCGPLVPNQMRYQTALHPVGSFDYPSSNDLLMIPYKLK